MPRVLDPELKQALAARLRYYNELGIYDFYRREVSEATVGGAPIASIPSQAVIQPEQREEMSARKATASVVQEESAFEIIQSRPEAGVSDPAKALKLIREDIGDCTRCRLAKQGRKQVVFGVGSPNGRPDVYRRSAGRRRGSAG